MTAKPRPGAPHAPVPWDASIAYALRALATGTASEGQQKHAIHWIINQAAGTYDLSWRESDRETSFAEGRRFVGLQIVKLLNLPAEAIQGNPHS